MNGRIRTLKPEWLDDELLGSCSSDARMLSAALILMADDYGNGRGSAATIASEVWRFQMAANDGVDAAKVIEAARSALAELEAARFVSLYTVEGQRYFAIRNWDKHQRVDKPGKPRVPGPESLATRSSEPETKRVAYFVRGVVTGLIKIGESIDPIARLADLARTGSEQLDLLAVGGVESDHHRELAADRVHGEWFKASPAVLAKIAEYGGCVEKPIASAGYDGSARKFATKGKNIPAVLAKVPAEFASDLDQDQDQEHIRDAAPAADVGAFSLEPSDGKTGTHRLPPPKPANQAREIFDYWRERTGHEGAKLDGKRRGRCEWALKTYGFDLAKLAIDGCVGSDFHMGRDANSNGKRYDEIELIFRDSTKFERFVAMTKGPRKAGSVASDSDRRAAERAAAEYDPESGYPPSGPQNTLENQERWSAHIHGPKFGGAA